MNINANEAINFVLKWLATGVVLYFGWKVGGLIDGVLPFI